jgi:hypothetical protein
MNLFSFGIRSIISRRIREKRRKKDDDNDAHPDCTPPGFFPPSRSPS